MATLGGYGPHTRAKHRILRRYLDAWLPIMARWRGPAQRLETDLVLIDGFAGSGRYDTGEPGSPLVMLDAYLEHEHRDEIRQRLHFVFIEKERAYVDQLRNELQSRDTEGLPVDIRVRHGLFAHEFPAAVGALEAEFGQLPPSFAFLDPFGLKDNTLELTSSLAVRRRCETLVYLPTGFMARFEATDEFAGALDNLYGGRENWRDAEAIEDFEARRLWLRDRFGSVLAAQTRGRALPFDIQPQGSPNIYSLVFSSQSRRGLQRMKEAMWTVDPAAGQFFRGGLRPRQRETLFDEVERLESDSYGASEPDYATLETFLRERFGTAPFRIEDALDFTLFSTVFRDDAHLKRPTLGAMERAGRLVVVRSPRERSIPGNYPDGTILRFTE